ncbi:GNAT family N-acetyltransferase [Rhizobium sp. LjRoot254]|uniref:GNAT family N-acetyltransferase n=1 Tax=Rhizobium sp. LjRoot254 TaxID=3342297 RepID=UPI003ECCE1CE
MSTSVQDNPAEHRYEMSISGGAMAAAYYRLDDGVVVLIHTEVPFEYSGSGIGTRLAEGVFHAIRKSGRRAAVRCEFMANFIARHPENRDVVIG